jgi:hypothetical protein
MPESFHAAGNVVDALHPDAYASQGDVKRPTIQDLPCFQPSCRLRVALICRGLIALCVIGGGHAGAAADDTALLRELRRSMASMLVPVTGDSGRMVRIEADDMRSMMAQSRLRPGGSTT